jgi:hypothetical protein
VGKMSGGYVKWPARKGMAGLPGLAVKRGPGKPGDGHRRWNADAGRKEIIGVLSRFGHPGMLLPC